MSSASTGMDLGWAVTSTLMSGLALFGGIGWLLDRWWGTRFVVAIGCIVGLGLGVYTIVMRYGRDPAASTTDDASAGSTNPKGTAQ